MRQIIYTLIVTLLMLSVLSCNKKDGMSDSGYNIYGNYTGQMHLHSVDSTYINHYGWSIYENDTTFQDTINVFNNLALSTVIINYKKYDFNGSSFTRINDTFIYNSANTYKIYKVNPNDTLRAQFSQPFNDSLWEEYKETSGPITGIPYVVHRQFFRGVKH